MQRVRRLGDLHGGNLLGSFACSCAVTYFGDGVTTSSGCQPQPELLWYRFDETGTSATNLASSPPTGTTTATIMGGQSQGGIGRCGGALIGSGMAASTDYTNTGWVTSLTGTSWTIAFWTSNIQPSATLFYIFGDSSASSFCCFTNGVAGASNWILRGPFTDVLVNGAATVAASNTAFVYDSVAGEIRAYLNGTLVNTVAQLAPTIAEPVHSRSAATPATSASPTAV